MAQYLSNLALGTKLKFGKYSVNGEPAQDIIWLIVAKSHQCNPAYPTNSITLITEKVIDRRIYDDKEPINTNTTRQQYGNNRYSVSNIDQWLNKDGAANAWYSPAHSADGAPSNNSTRYDTRPAFLNAFTEEEKAAILTTTISVNCNASLDGVGAERISRKVFLPSLAEMLHHSPYDQAEGSAWALRPPRTVLTEQAYNNTLGTKPTKITDYVSFLLRSPDMDSPVSVYHEDRDGLVGSSTATVEGIGIRPACNLSSTLLVSDTTDSEGCYTVAWNIAPSAPTALNLPTKILGGKTSTVSWSASVDPEGDAISYILECAYDGGEFSTIYAGTNLTYTHSVTYGKTSVQYRVKAVDTHGKAGAYTTSAVRTVINNKTPVVSGADTNLGTKTQGFSQTYSVTDGDNDAVTVVERIDGVLIRSYAVSLGATNTFAVTGETWLALANGTHSMTITATDIYGDSAVRTYTFTKSVASLSIQNTTPMISSSKPVRIALVVTRNIPAEAEFKVEVCNNGFDASPTWEDCTASVKSSNPYVFTNSSKTADNWGVVIRVTVNRNGGEGACYISSIGGNFE